MRWSDARDSARAELAEDVGDPGACGARGAWSSMKRIDFFPTGDGRLELCGEGGVDNRRADLRLPPAVKLGKKAASGLTAVSA